MSDTPAIETTVVANARLELLIPLARVEDMTTIHQEAEAAGVVSIRTGGPIPPGCWPTHVPLFVGEWCSSHEDIELAARECTLLGEIEYNNTGHHPNGPMVRITPKGYAWIRSHQP